MSLPWRAVVLRHLEEEMRTTPKKHALIAVPYVRYDLQHRFAWRMTGLTMEEYDSDERKRSKEERVLLMTSLRDLMTPKRSGSSVCETERRSLFRPIHDRTNISASFEYLCPEAERR